jgi:CDP-diacylglycerol--glycerol-3-phosphate 3-phosphatidyltransferase
MFLIVGCLVVTWRGMATLALFLFVLAAVSDWLDGWYARKQRIVSDFGKLMDALVDKILMVGLFIAFLSTGMLPSWALFGVLIILSREFLITGLRLLAGAKGVVLAAEKSGKIKTVLQILAAGLLISAEVFQRDGLVLGGTQECWSWWAEQIRLSGWIAFVIAVLLTLTSGTGYLYKYRELLLDSGDRTASK